MQRKNLHIYPSFIGFETRILKETKSLVEMKLVDNIEIASILEEGLQEFEKIDTKRCAKRFKLLIQRYGKSRIIKGLRYLEFFLKVFLYYKNEKIKFINCHSLLVLIIGVLLKKAGNSEILIYDPHELETERVGLTGIARQLTKWLEKILIRYVDKTIVVCDPIADWYQKEYGLEEVYVVQNMPYPQTRPLIKPTLLKDKFKIPYHHILFIYQGLLMKGRGIDNFLEVFINAPMDKHIVFMGYGEYEEQIKTIATNYSNIHFHAAVKPDEIIKYTSSADIGLNFIIGDICLSYQYSLPNKFGEYILSGIPVLVSSSLIYLTSIVKNERCGWSVDSNNNHALISFIDSINKSTIMEVNERVLCYADKIGWNFEELEYLKIYK